MGTTADKLNKVLQTKEAIRTAINNKGGTLTESDTFASYPTAIENIQSGGKEEETKSITITENGTTTVLPTSGKVLSKVDIVANVQSGGGVNPLQSLLDRTKSAKYLFTGVSENYSNYTQFYNMIDSELEAFMSGVDTSNVTNMRAMFLYCKSLTSIPQFNTSACTDMGSMFSGCTNLTTIPQLDTSKVTNMRSMFTSCYYLTIIPEMDTSKVTNMNSMFSYCENLTTIPQLNTSNVTNMSSMFRNCSKLTTFPQLDTSKVTNMSYMFESSGSKETIPQLDTSNVTDMTCMFQNAYIKRIPQLNMNKVTSASGMFFGDNVLEYVELLNVRVNLQIGTAGGYGRLIEKDCLIQIISELIKPSSETRTLTMGTDNKAKIANTYVKLLADDGTGKYPFEVCASTDEGAMTIEAYCNGKNWTLA